MCYLCKTNVLYNWNLFDKMLSCIVNIYIPIQTCYPSSYSPETSEEYPSSYSPVTLQEFPIHIPLKFQKNFLHHIPLKLQENIFHHIPLNGVPSVSVNKAFMNIQMNKIWIAIRYSSSDLGMLRRYVIMARYMIHEILRWYMVMAYALEEH